jgi:large subunit ribosomal protein L9
MRRSREQKDATLRSSAQEIASRLVPTVIAITAKAGPEGKLFGSVGSAEIAEAVLTQTSIEIDRRQILVDEPIRTVGTHSVPAKLHAEVEFPITIEVTAAQ